MDTCLSDINLKLESTDGGGALIKKLHNPLKRLNNHLSTENRTNLHSQIKDLFAKISAIYHKIMSDIQIPGDDWAELKPFAKELARLDWHAAILQPSSRKHPSLVRILKQPLDVLKIELGKIDNADESFSEGINEKTLNRYSNIIPYNFNRAKLSTGRYISVSDVEIGNKRCLIGSAPIKDYRRNTVTDWWQLIIEKNSRLIVATTNNYEYKRQPDFWMPNEKCYPYWASQERINQFLKPLEGWICESLSDQEVMGQVGCQKIIKQIITLSGPNDDIREITHLQFLNWFDEDIADTLLSLQFEEIITAEEAKYKTQKHPPLYHCSAGIGRTGVILAIHMIKSQIREEKKSDSISIDVMKTIKTLRTQRAHMVQKASQVKMIARAALIALTNED